MENPIKMDDLGGKPTIFGNIHKKYLTCKQTDKNGTMAGSPHETTIPMAGPVALRRHNNFRSIGRWGWGGKNLELRVAPESLKIMGRLYVYKLFICSCYIGCFIPLIMNPTFISTLVFQKSKWIMNNATCFCLESRIQVRMFNPFSHYGTLDPIGGVTQNTSWTWILDSTLMLLGGDQRRHRIGCCANFQSSGWGAFSSIESTSVYLLWWGMRCCNLVECVQFFGGFAILSFTLSLSLCLCLSHSCRGASGVQAEITGIDWRDQTRVGRQPKEMNEKDWKGFCLYKLKTAWSAPLSV